MSLDLRTALNKTSEINIFFKNIASLFAKKDIFMRGLQKVKFNASNIVFSFLENEYVKSLHGISRIPVYFFKRQTINPNYEQTLSITKFFTE